MMGGIYLDKAEYAVSTWTLEALPIVEALRLIREAGFTAVELWADTVHLDPRANPNRAEVLRALGRYGQTVHSVHAPFRNFENPPAAESQFRNLRMDLWKRTLDDCARFEASILVMHAVNAAQYNYPLEEAGIIRECLTELVEYGAGLNVHIALENIPSGGRMRGEISCTIENQRKLFAIPGLKFCLDIGHAPLTQSDPFREADAAGTDLVTLHIHNNDGLSDLHALPDHGIIDWPSLRAHLRAGGYRGRFVLEVCGGVDPAAKIQEIAALFGERPS